MSRSSQAAGFVLAVLFTCAVARGADPVDPADRLATELCGAAIVLLEPQPLTVDRIEIALLLIQEAVALAPGDPELVRLLIEVATLAERQEVVGEAVKRLVRLDPDDDRARLRRLTTAIDRYQVVDQRYAAYEKLLSDPANLRRLGDAVASRLALDLALLRRRNGDVAGYANWLARSAALDSANPDAAALAAGYFMSNVEDPVSEVELLIDVLLANPTDVATQVDLARLLLEHGAHRSAARLYGLVVASSNAAGYAASDAVVADRALAVWATGDQEAARRMMADRQRLADVRERQRVKAEQPAISPMDLANVNGHVDPMLAVARAALEDASGYDATLTLEQAFAAFEARIDGLVTAGAPADEVRMVRLQAAGCGLWLGVDVDRARALVEQAASVEPLTGLMQTRLDGWARLREGRLDDAVEILGAAAADDAAAQLGIAVAHGERGDAALAADAFAEVVRREPGSVIGIWSLQKRRAITGDTLPPSEQAARMDELAAGIPRMLDRYPGDPTLALSIRIRARAADHGPYDPVVVDLEMRNQSVLPLAISGGGPIRTQIMLSPTLQVAGATALGTLPPIVVDIDRRLRLMPRESIVIPVDLTRTRVGQVLNAWPLAGGILRLDAITNFVVTPDGVGVAGIYGTEIRAPLIRVSGIDVDDAWVDEAIRLVESSANAPDLVRVAELLHVVSSARSGEGPYGGLGRMDEAASVVARAFGSFGPIEQAWLLAILPRGTEPEGLLSIVQRSEDRLVRLVYLMFHLSGADDPMLDAAGRGDDESVKRVAEFMRAMQQTGSDAP